MRMSFYSAFGYGGEPSPFNFCLHACRKYFSYADMVSRDCGDKSFQHPCIMQSSKSLPDIRISEWVCQYNSTIHRRTISVGVQLQLCFAMRTLSLIRARISRFLFPRIREIIILILSSATAEAYEIVGWICFPGDRPN